MDDPTDDTISRIISALQENADCLKTLDAANLEYLRYEAQDWASHGFGPEEVAEWIQAGYERLADVARVLCGAGLSPRQAECALLDNCELLDPDTEDEFFRRALKYRTCCIGRQ